MRTKKELIADIKYLTKLDEYCTKRAKYRTKMDEEAKKELKEPQEQG